MTYTHPPSSTFCFREFTLVVALRMKRHVHGWDQCLSGSSTHLADVSPLGVFVNTQDEQCNDAFYLNRHIWMKRPPSSGRRAPGQCTRRWGIGVQYFGLDLDTLHGRFRKRLGKFPSIKHRLGIGRIFIIMMRDQSQDCWNCKSDRRWRFEITPDIASVTLPVFVPRPRRWAIYHWAWYWRRQNRKVWMDENVISI